MDITDKEVLRQLKIVRCSELEELLSSYPESERDGRSDMQILADEAGYLLDMYNEEGTGHYRDLCEARWVLREACNGKVMPLVLPNLKPKYSKEEIEDYKGTVNGYRRLTSLIGRLSDMGY